MGETQMFQPEKMNYSDSERTFPDKFNDPMRANEIFTELKNQVEQ